MISNFDQRPLGAVDYMQGSKESGYGHASALGHHDGYVKGGHQYARGATQSAQSQYARNLNAASTQPQSRAHMSVRQGSLPGYHQQSDELNVNESRHTHHQSSVNYQPQQHQQSYQNAGGFGPVSNNGYSNDRGATGALSQPGTQADMQFRSKFGRGMAHGPGDNPISNNNNNENQNQLNQDYMRQMERLDAGIYQFKKEYEIQVNDVRQPGGNYPVGHNKAPAGAAHQYDNAQDFLGESNISAINPTQSDANMRHSQQSLPNQRDSLEKYSNFAERFAAIDQMQPSAMMQGSTQDQQASLPTQESNLPYTYQTAQFSQGFAQVQQPGQGHLVQSQRSSKELLTITIEIGNGQNENIHINEGDSPHALAADFARRHGINEQLTELLAEQIRLNIEQLASESRENSAKYPRAIPENDTFGRQTQLSDVNQQTSMDRAVTTLDDIQNSDDNVTTDAQLPQRANLHRASNGEGQKQSAISEPKSKNHANTLTTTLTRPPTYDERMDEVASIGSILSGATGKAKHAQVNVNEGVLSTAVDEQHTGSTQLNAIATNNHRSSVQPPSSKYLNAVDALYDRSRGSQPNIAAGHPMGMLAQGVHQQMYQQHASNMPPLYPGHPRSQAGAPEGSGQGSVQFQNTEAAREHSGSAQYNGQDAAASGAAGLEYQEKSRDAISINDEGKHGNNNFPPSPPILSQLDHLTINEQQQYAMTAPEQAASQGITPHHVQASHGNYYQNPQMNQSAGSLAHPTQAHNNDFVDYSLANQGSYPAGPGVANAIDTNVPASLLSDRADPMNAFYNNGGNLAGASVATSLKGFGEVKDQMMGIGVGAKNFIDPNSQTYLNWYRGLNKKLERNRQSMYEPKEVLQKPQISLRSQQIVEQKRYGSTKGSRSGSTCQPSHHLPVHQRLHQQAVAKQRALRTMSNGGGEDGADDADERGSVRGRGNRWRSLPRGGSRGSANEFGERIHYASSNNLVAPGQARFGQDPRYGARLRSASVQGRAALPGGDKRFCNTTHKNNFSEAMSSQGDGSAARKNYGELLYERGMRRKEEIKRLIKRARSEHDKAELEELTFQPKINAISKNMTRMNNERAEDFLIKYGKAVKEKVDSQRVDKLRAETEGLTFQPKVSKVSERIVMQKKGQTAPSESQYSKFDSLYQDARRRQERQEFIYSACIESECTFQPDTEKTKYFNAQAISSLKSSSGAKHVFQRLSHRMNSSQDRKRMYIENSRSLNNELFDPETGQTLFQPKVGRGPRGRSRSKDANDHLYRQGQIARDRKMSMQKQHLDNIRKDAERNFSKNKTNKIIEKKKALNFSKIFDKLDSDHDGQISAYRIDISSLEPDLLQVLTPLFVEMEELGMNLDREEFIDAATRLYESVSLPEKNILVNRRFGSRSNSARARSTTFYDPQQSQQLFKPRLNPNSLKMAERINHGVPTGPTRVADRLLDKGREYDRKVKERKTEQQSLELLGCTFHPKLMASPQGSATSTNRKTAGLRSFGGAKSPDNLSSTANPTSLTGGIDVNLLAKQVVHDLFKHQRQGDPHLMQSMSAEQPLQADGLMGRPPRYQNQFSGQITQHLSRDVGLDPQTYTESNMIPRQIIGLPAEAGSFLDLPRKSPNGSKLTQGVTHTDNTDQSRHLLVKNNPSAAHESSIKIPSKSKELFNSSSHTFDKAVNMDEHQALKTKQSAENYSQVSTNQLPIDELGSVSTGQGNMLNFQAQATASINQLLRDSYTQNGSSKMITTNMTTNTFTQRHNAANQSIGSRKV